MVVRECKATEFADCDVVFSGLDSDVAGEIGASPHPSSNTFCLFNSDFDTFLFS